MHRPRTRVLPVGTLMACSTGSGANGIFLMFTIVQCFFGVGVGGEYPVASTSANERAENTKHLQQRRGETVVCVFSMQGGCGSSGSIRCVNKKAFMQAYDMLMRCPSQLG